MTVSADGSVRHEVVVDLSLEEAFWRFADLDAIKPREHNLLSVPIERTVLDQRAGGDVYDVGIDGSVCRWGRVLTFDPPRKIAFTWDIGPDWQVVTDPATASEVDVTFDADGEHRTRVVLVHRNIDRHGAGWESLQGNLDSPGGWLVYLDRFLSLAHDRRRIS